MQEPARTRLGPVAPASEGVLIGRDPAPTIVVGCDGREQTRDAVALGESLARVGGARLVLATACAPEMRGDADARLAELAAGVDSAPVEQRTVAEESPARMLHDLAESTGAEAIVVGSTHRGRIGRVMPGTVGKRLLSAAPCAVAIAPRRLAARPRHVAVVGVAYDLTPESREALALGVDIARAFAASLRIVTVDEPHTRDYADALAAGAADPRPGRRAVLHSELVRVSTALPDELRAEAHVRRGLPATELIKETGEGIDLLVLGSRGYGPLGRVFAGSVSIAVAAGAHCAVIVVPRGSGSAPHGQPARGQEIDVDVVESADDQVRTGAG